MIHVWLLDTAEVGIIPRELLNCLDRSEEEMAVRIRTIQEKRRYLLGRILLRQALTHSLGGYPHSWRLIAGETGKVRLAYQPGIPFVDFNLSYSGSVVAVAVSKEGAVGLDIEGSDRVGSLGSMAEDDSIYTSRESAYLMSLSAAYRSSEALRLWTLKEAWAKLLALGVHADFSKLEVWPEASGVHFDSRKISLNGSGTLQVSVASRSREPALVHLPASLLLGSVMSRASIAQKDFVTERTARKPPASSSVAAWMN